MHHFWEMVGFIANTILFFVTGQVIAYKGTFCRQYFESVVFGFLICALSVLFCFGCACLYV